MTAEVHMVAGSTGAGKTTYAMKLADELGAVRFSIDEWMVTLFGPDQPAGGIQFPWMMARITRCEAMIWSTVLQLGARGVPTVLDLGFTKAEHRARVTGWANEAGLSPRLHYVDVPMEERWARVQRRNTQKGETYRLEVTRPMFDFVERMWEPPTADELARR